MELEDKINAGLERLRKRDEEEQAAEKAKVEALRQAYMKRTGRTEYKA